MSVLVSHLAFIWGPFSVFHSGPKAPGNAFVSDAHPVLGVLWLQMLTLLRLVFTWLLGI